MHAKGKIHNRKQAPLPRVGNKAPAPEELRFPRIKVLQLGGLNNCLNKSTIVTFLIFWCVESIWE